jgi:glycine/D-amino acid oxidase-like deaminating enzyme
MNLFYNNNNNNNNKIIVIGGGIIGLTSAIELQENGWEVMYLSLLLK